MEDNRAIGHLGDVNSLLGPGGKVKRKSQKPTFNDKVRDAFRIMDRRLAEQENRSRDVRQQTLNMIEAVLTNAGKTHDEMKTLRNELAETKQELADLKGSVDSLLKDRYELEGRDK